MVLEANYFPVQHKEVCTLVDSLHRIDDTFRTDIGVVRLTKISDFEDEALAYEHILRFDI